MVKTQSMESRAQRWRNRFFYYVTIFPAVAYVTLFFVIILFNLLLYSFTEYSGGVAQNATVQNYITVFTSEEFHSAYVRTLLFVFVVTPAQLVTGFVTASLINRSFRGRGLIRGIFMLPITLPTLVTAAIFFILFSTNGHINALLLGQYSFFPKVIDAPISFVGSSVGSFFLTALVKVWRDTPASMLILLAGMQSIDGSQYEAAMTMGATALQRVFYITVPSLVPSIASVLVLRSIEAWKEFVFPYILSPSYPLLSLLIDRYYNVAREPGLTAVVGLVLIVSIVIFSQTLKWLLNLLNRYLVKV